MERFNYLREKVQSSDQKTIQGSNLEEEMGRLVLYTGKLKSRSPWTDHYTLDDDSSLET